MGFSRQEYWSGLPFPSPGDPPNLGIEPMSPESPSLAGGFSTTGPPGKPFTTSSCPQFAFLILSYGARPVSITRAACLRQGLAFYRRTLPPPLQVSLEQTRWQVQVNLESLQLTCTLWGVFSQTSWCLRFMILCLRHVITYYISQLNITYANIMSLEGRVASLKAQLNDLKRFNKGNNICFKLGVGDSGGK